MTRRLFVALSPQWDKIFRSLGKKDDKTSLGLKEALSIGIANAVASLSRPDGYFRNELVKILLPPQFRAAEKAMRLVGLGNVIDQFVLSMNRAAETAAPYAKDIFVSAIQSMTFDDARKILTGSSNTAATEFFKDKTTPKLTDMFKPVVQKSMAEAGVTKQYQAFVTRLKTIPFVKAESLDLDQYVVSKALEGLFFTLGEEERKIRTNPAARVTSLLKEVFGGLSR